MAIRMLYRTTWLAGLALLLGRCAPTAFSPHAQHEMVTPYNRDGEIHELGAASSLNHWFITEQPDTIYIRTHPAASLNLFHNAYLASGTFGFIGGVESLFCPASWWVPEDEGFVFVFTPHLGLQLAGANLTLRLRFAPYNLGFVAGGDGDAGLGANFVTFYQLSLLLHNRQPSRHSYWIGMRNTPSALGGLAGGQYSFSDRTAFRAECSILAPPPFSPFFDEDDLNTIRGRVFYITAGMFFRVK